MIKKFTLVILTAVLVGCVSNAMKEYTVFNPYVTKDGKQSFTFVAHKELPSYLDGFDRQAYHEGAIGNELGAWKYCLDGYEITDVKEVENSVIYTGVCN